MSQALQSVTPPPLKRAFRAGFSLVELSIVLVILGLLIGGILAGRSLIRASELRAVLTEFNHYVAAAQAFEDQYSALPGDMPNATALWGIAAGTTGNDNTCRNTVQNTTTTCNGNGNGTLALLEYDAYLFWKHLANAALIEGNFSGTFAASGGLTGYTANMPRQRGAWNVPLSKVGGGFWSTENYGNWNAAIQKFYGAYVSSSPEPHYINSLWLLPTSGQEPWNGGVISSPEAWNLDMKIDDGRPGSGSVEAMRGGNNVQTGPCLTAADPALAQYDLRDSRSNQCNIVFVRALN